MPVWDGARGLVVEQLGLVDRVGIWDGAGMVVQLGLVDRDGWYVRSRWLWCNAGIVLGAVFDLSGRATRNWVRGVVEVLFQRVSGPCASDACGSFRSFAFCDRIETRKKVKGLKRA